MLASGEEVTIHGVNIALGRSLSLVAFIPHIHRSYTQHKGARQCRERAKEGGGGNSMGASHFHYWEFTSLLLMRSLAIRALEGKRNNWEARTFTLKHKA
jgi:hypothetical protein